MAPAGTMDDKSSGVVLPGPTFGPFSSGPRVSSARTGVMGVKMGPTAAASGTAVEFTTGTTMPIAIRVTSTRRARRRVGTALTGATLRNA